MNSFSRLVWRLLVVVGIGLVAAACHQNGTVFAVDTTNDTFDITPGDGICADVNGDCSLRAAVMEANILPGVEEIALVDGQLYELTREGTGARPTAGDLAIMSPVVVTGNATIRGDGGGQAVWIEAETGLVEFDGQRFTPELDQFRVAGGASVAVSHAAFDGVPVVVDDGSLSIWSSSFAVSTDGIRATGGDVYLENVSMLGTSGARDLIRADGSDVKIISSSLSLGDIFGASGGGSVFVQSSVLDVDCGNNVVSLGHNLGRSSCLFSEAGDVESGAYPVTRALADNGGESLTLELNPFGAGVDAGRTSGCTLTGRDARGVLRPYGAACDIGAMELEIGVDCGSPGPGADLRYCDFRGADLAGLDLSGADAANANFEGADLTAAGLVATSLTRATLTDARFDGADFTDADLSHGIGAFYADDANFTRANLEGAAVESAARADFTDAYARDFETSRFGASMADTHIDGADFTGGAFWGVVSGGISGTATFGYGVDVVNGYLIDDYVELDGVDLSGSSTVGDAFSRVRITNSDLSGLRISVSYSARYSGSNLGRTDWTDTAMDYSAMDNVSLVSADMKRASLIFVDLSDSVVVGVDFADTVLFGVNFSDATLLLNTWDNTLCPSGVNSDDNGGNCDGQFTRGAPSVGGGAAVPAEFEGMSVEDFGTGGVVDE